MLITWTYGGMYVPNFLLLLIAHLQRRKLNYDALNWITTSRRRKLTYDVVNELRRRKLNYDVMNSFTTS